MAAGGDGKRELHECADGMVKEGRQYSQDYQWRVLGRYYMSFQMRVGGSAWMDWETDESVDFVDEKYWKKEEVLGSKHRMILNVVMHGRESFE